MGRTLYLFENDGITATLDGPSLWIERPLKAGQRIPLRLISRVFLVGEIKISSTAILALAEHNIPLVLAPNLAKIKQLYCPLIICCQNIIRNRGLYWRITITSSATWIGLKHTEIIFS